MFQQLMQRYGEDLDKTMRRVADTVPDTVPGLSVMVRYPMGWVDENNKPYSGITGKRVRPMFLLLCNEAAGGNWQDALYAAAAVELLHNFSLIHDDIQDDSPVRHNRPTVWKLWGQANAINTGDILFSLAFVALQNLASTGIEPQHLIKIWEIFNFTNLELTRGQHLDMQFETRGAVSIDEYISMITGKSAALLAACAQIGSYIASGDQHIAERFAEYALNLGIAFQIHDDILGIWGDADVTGKSTATDIVSKKKSLPVLYGLSNSEELRQIYTQDELSQRDVEKAVSLLDGVGAQEYTRSMEARYYNHALETLEKVAPQGEAVSWLRQFTTALFERSS